MFKDSKGQTVAITGNARRAQTYYNFSDLFDDPEANAHFIWSSNLVHDNAVLKQKIIQ